MQFIKKIFGILILVVAYGCTEHQKVDNFKGYTFIIGNAKSINMPTSIKRDDNSTLISFSHDDLHPKVFIIDQDNKQKLTTYKVTSSDPKTLLIDDFENEILLIFDDTQLVVSNDGN